MVYNTGVTINTMEFSEYQKRSRATAKYSNLGFNFIFPTLGLAGEAGEIANKIKKIARDDKGEISEESRAKVKDELGDLVWYVSQLATELEIPLEEIVQANIAKIESRP
jgi:NTP pyrophosphatase (non-canonical NTP hydrolase)